MQVRELKMLQEQFVYGSDSKRRHSKLKELLVANQAKAPDGLPVIKKTISS